MKFATFASLIILLGAGSAFAESLAAGGMSRAEQLRRLTIGACSSPISAPT